MDRDTTTRTGARAPGVERLSRSNGGVVLSHEPRHRARTIQVSDGTKDGCKPSASLIRRNKGRPRSISRPWSRTGENPPYGILGRTMETSASFEARSAPSSYPTAKQSGYLPYLRTVSDKPSTLPD